MKKAVVIVLLVVIIILIASGKKYIDESVKFAYPVVGRISSKYGEKRSTGIHNGVDIAAPTGTPILAPEKGIITRVWNDSANGNAISMIHYQGYTSGYAHLSKVSVKVGETIGKGQKIGEVGSTGRSTGPHLHWVVRQYGFTIDPLTLLKA
jgi:murein DD-endopeptidase MepM/ murein hydrolase activator NlpD